MTYTVKEIYITLQGEGAHTGRLAVFCRFSGCNLWTGREEDRDTAICQFCDTNFVGHDGTGGGKFSNAHELAEAINQCWGISDPIHKFVVFTGGEPLLQLDRTLIEAIKSRGFQIAIETNGTINVPVGIDWICLSPKLNSQLHVLQADEIKLVWPQPNCSDSYENVLARFEKMSFKHYFIQPLDDSNRQENTNLAIKICQLRPKWRLSLQTHKYLGIR